MECFRPRTSGLCGVEIEAALDTEAQPRGHSYQPTLEAYNDAPNALMLSHRASGACVLSRWVGGCVDVEAEWWEGEVRRCLGSRWTGR